VLLPSFGRFVSYKTFIELNRILEPEIVRIHKEYTENRERRRKERRSERKRIDQTRWKQFVHNGVIPTTTRLAIAIRYFAGGSFYDLAPLFGVGLSNTIRSIWLIVEAVMETLCSQWCDTNDYKIGHCYKVFCWWELL
jgi:hypothetical protein